MYFHHGPFMALLFGAYFTGGCSTAVDGYSPPDAAPASPPDGYTPSDSYDAAWQPSYCAVGVWQLTASYVDGTCTKPFLDFDKNYTVTLVDDHYRVEEENGLEVGLDAHQGAPGTCRAAFRESSNENDGETIDLLLDLTERGEIVTGTATISLGTSESACTHTFAVTGTKVSSVGGGK